MAYLEQSIVSAGGALSHKYSSIQGEAPSVVSLFLIQAWVPVLADVIGKDEQSIVSVLSAKLHKVISLHAFLFEASSSFIQAYLVESDTSLVEH